MKKTLTLRHWNFKKILFKKHNFISVVCFKAALVSLMIAGFSNGLLAQSQQVIGSFPVMDGGFEGQISLFPGGTVATTGTQSSWTTQSAATSTLVSTGGRSGSKYVTLFLSTASTGTSGHRRFVSPTTASGAVTKQAYQVQYYYRLNTNCTVIDGISRGGASDDGTSGSQYGTGVAATDKTQWVKYTGTATITSTTVTTGVGIIDIYPTTATTPIIIDFDDFVMYAGSSADAAAPNSAGTVSFTNVMAAQQTVNWVAASGGVDGGGYVVVRFASSPNADQDPNQGGVYALNNTITNGTNGTNNPGKVVYIGTGTSFNDTGLNPNSTYYYKVYTVDKAFNYAAETSGSSTTGSASLSSEPSTQASAVSTTFVSTSSFTVNWTAGNGTSSIVLVKAGSIVDADPVDGTTYIANAAAGTGNQIGNGNMVVYNGAGNSVTITGLTKGTTYYVKVYTFNGSAGTENYNVTSPPSGSQDVGNIITSAGTGAWGTTGTWTGGVLPTASDFVVIQNGHTVDMATSNSPVNSITINSGGKLYSSSSSGTMNLQVYGLKIKCDGTFGDPSNTASYNIVDFASNVTISGSGSINIYKMRPLSGYFNSGVTFASNTNLTYGTASIQSDNTNNDNVTFNVNSGVTLALGGNMNTTSSAFSNGAANTTWNINGTVNVPNGYFSPLVNAGKTFTCNINNGGSLSVLNLQVTQTGGASPTINVASGGTFTVTGTNCDLSGPALTVIQGGGTFATSATVGVKVSNASGLNSSTGPIRTSTVNFDPATSFTYGYYTTQSSTTALNSTGVTLSAANSNIVVGMGVSGTGIATGTTVSAVSGTSLTLSQNATAAGTATLTYYSTTLAAQTTGDKFPASFGALTIINPAGVTLTNSTTVNGTLSLTAGTLYVGSGNTLTLKSSRAGSGYIDGAGGTIAYSGSSSSQTASLLQNVNNLVVNNTAATTPGLTLQAATTVNGTLTLTAGLIYNGSNPNITMASGSNIVCSGGGFQSAAPVFAGTVNLNYNGASPQTTSYELPTSSSVLNNLTISNAAGVSLNADATVNGTLTLTNGTLSLGAKNLTISASGSISGASASNYIVTNGAGTLTQSVGAGSTVLFPIGSSASSSYDPATVTPTDATSISAKVSSTLSHTLDENTTHAYINPREWTLTSTAPSSTQVTLKPSAFNPLYVAATYNVIGTQYGTTEDPNNYAYVSATNNSDAMTASFSSFTAPFVTGRTDLTVAALNPKSGGVYASNGSIVVENAMGNTIEIYASTGKLIQIAKCNSDNQRFTTGKGMFIVKNGSKVNKIVVR